MCQDPPSWLFLAFFPLLSRPYLTYVYEFSLSYISARKWKVSSYFLQSSFFFVLKITPAIKETFSEYLFTK